MPTISIGDMARHFNATRTNLQIRDRMVTLGQELSSGLVADLPAHLGGDQARLADLDRRIALSDSFGRASRELGQMLSVIQTTFDSLDSMRATLADQFIQITENSPRAQRTQASEAGAQGFVQMVDAFNTRFGNNALFAGAATDGAALAPAQDMLDDIRIAIGGAVAATDVIDAITQWFDDPAGGFATMGYLGDTGAPLTRTIDTGAEVTVTARADHAAIRDLLKAGAIAAMAGDPALGLPDDTTAYMLRESGLQMMAVVTPLTELRAAVGLSEERVEIATSRLAARKAALTVMRNDLSLADPYETATALQAVQTQLETHYTLTARMARLTLTEYLR